MSFALTAQQTSFIDALLTTTSNIALIARAGCGKTSTIIAAVVRYAAKCPKDEVTVCMFNKSNQIDADKKLKAAGLDNWKQWQAATSHSMGFGLVKFAFKNPKVDDAKVRNLIRERNELVYQQYGAQIRELVHLGKVEGFGFFDDAQIGDASAWYELADHYDVNGFDDTSDMDTVIEAAQRIYRASLSQTDTIDFDDMILFPLVKNLKVKFQRDLVIIDEAQDTSRARRALMKKFVKSSGRMIVVGDDRQAIMGFAGASADALTELVNELSAVQLPLTVTWRCPKAVVREAQRIVPDITAADDAIEGEVLRMPEMPAELLPTDAILCRNTAPLIEQAYQLIKRGVACKVEGRDIGKNLLHLVDRWSTITTVTAFLDKLEDYRDREVQKATAKGKDAKVQEIDDRCDTLVAICQAVKAKGRHDLNGVREFIADLFADDVSGILTLCTYHRSKGREWKRVLLLEHAKRCPSKFAKQAWQLHQENNLAYVAITRAQETLVYVS